MKRFLVLILALFFPVFASADINVAGYITENTTWSPGNGVVIIGPGVTVMPGVTLTIEPGTILKAGPSSPGMVFWLEILGTLVAEGTDSEPIYFTSMRDDSIGEDTNGDGDNSAPQALDWIGIIFREGSVGSIKYSILRYAGGFSGSHPSGLSNLGGSVSIENSSFENNFQSDILQSAGSLTVASSTFDRNNIAIRITGGNLVATPGNSFATTSTVENLSVSEVDMRNNWWGSETGPQPIDKVGEAEGSFIYGPILYEPWLLAPPGENTIEECCSSVIFLPGLKGSVLIKRSLLNDVPNDQLWPSASNWNDDMAQLDLGEDGEGNAKIVVGGIVESYLGVDIYSSFADFMDELVSGGLINEWLPRSYDWRFSPEKILEDGVKTEDGVIDLIEELKELASRSQTGQVAIVAHSMGGFMGKAIIKELEEQGKDDLVDSFVMVGTPQLGTPESVAALLHGHEDFGGRFLFNQVETRKTGRNMPSAYNLLPAPEYFNAVLDPVVTLDTEASFTEEWRDEWDDEINNYPDFSSFLTGGEGVRERPEEDDLLKPEVLRNDLVEEARDFHNEFDNYQLPEHIRVVQVAGWGISTIKAVNYRNRHFVQAYEPKFTREGDKTVVYPSAISLGDGEIYYFNLYLHRGPDNKQAKHANIMSTDPVEDLVSYIVNEDIIKETPVLTNIKPDVTDTEDQLIVSAHSPVLLGVYDELSNFTGINPNQNLSGDTAEITENIPGSTYLYFGENQYIFLPKEGRYSFVYKGIGNGSTTIEIKDFVADVETLIAAYSDIPTTEATTATFSVDSENPDTTIIKLDTNSDGETDEIVVSDDTDIYDLLAMLKGKIMFLDIKDKLKQNLLKKIDNLKKKIEKKTKKDKSLENLKKKIENLIKRILKKEEKNLIGEADANDIIKLLEQIESEL